jgi:early secretory antigenic target protein ESAT-6
MADDGRILVNFATISDAGDQVRAAADRIQAHLDELRAGVTQIAESWTGAARDGYRARQKIWDDKAAELHTTLRAIAGALDHAHEGYTTTEKANTDLWYQH